MATPAVVPPPRVGDQVRGGFPISFAGCAHFLKLRHNWRASDRLRLEYGLNYDVKQNLSTPWAGVRLQLDDRLEGWGVEICTDWAVLCTPQIDLVPFTHRVSLPISLRLGKDFFNGGQPHVEVGVHKPPVAIGMVLLALAAGAPIHIKRKEAGGFAVSMPITFKDGRTVAHSMQPRAEIDATIVRNGMGLNVVMHQMNAVLRLRQA